MLLRPQHDDRIWAESEPREGSQFHFTLSKDMAMKNEPVSLAKIQNGFE
jgi:hypothetical protein